MGVTLYERKFSTFSADLHAQVTAQADTVAAAAAASQGVSKADIVGNADSDAAVRLALAETAVIGDTKRYLEEVRWPSA